MDPFIINQINEPYAGKQFIAEIILDTMEEVKKATDKFPWWPESVYAGQCVVSEECGEAIKATVDYVQKDGSIEDIIKEHIQAAAMHIRQAAYITTIAKGVI